MQQQQNNKLAAATLQRKCFNQIVSQSDVDTYMDACAAYCRHSALGKRRKCAHKQIHNFRIYE